jgi:predicted ArsR family transcriptional regulator
MRQGRKLIYRHLERIVRGFSNHRRIQILELLQKEPELSVVEISERLDIEYKTAAEHIRRLAITGLVLKRSAGNAVRHTLSSRGISILKFLRTLE